MDRLEEIKASRIKWDGVSPAHIDWLIAEVEKLRNERELKVGQWNDYWQREKKELEAEIEKLRSLLLVLREQQKEDFDRAERFRAELDAIMAERQELRTILCVPAPVGEDVTAIAEFDPHLPLIDSARSLRAELAEARREIEHLVAEHKRLETEYEAEVERLTKRCEEAREVIMSMAGGDYRVTRWLEGKP